MDPRGYPPGVCPFLRVMWSAEEAFPSHQTSDKEKRPQR